MRNKEYNPREIEKKWQEIWEKEEVFKALKDYEKPKYYALIEFPYPSAEGLHVGHTRPYTAMDIIARKRRLEGYNVLFPMGWDAFGLPTENYAIKNKIHPGTVTERNVSNYRNQLRNIGMSFDWSREVNTTDPNYFKWTQWIFLKLFEKGLAYKAEMPVNWCTSCKIVLANEEVVEGACERCGGDVIEKTKSQWMLKITAYADKLLEGLEGVDYPERVKTQQINWIGRTVEEDGSISYNLRDWVFSRQRYWGEPISLIYCEDCGWVPVPEDQLPLTLPEIDGYEPTDTGESPLSIIDEWVNTSCPTCGRQAKRETDTMPQWAGSSWYFLRYTDPNNAKELASKESLEYWMAVDWYNGGMEHTTLHLLYSRFWHRFLYDIGAATIPEPYKKRTSHGMILGENNEKMSKSRGNVTNPDGIINSFGADSLRTYVMFIGAFEQSAVWCSESINGCRRFLEKVWRLAGLVNEEMGYSKDLEREVHKTIKKVSEDYEKMKFNTAIAAMMSFVSRVYAVGSITPDELKILLILLNPAAPHITEEIWQQLGFDGMVCQAAWPAYDEKMNEETVMEIGVQVNGRLRGTIEIDVNAEQEEAYRAASENEAINQHITGKAVQKIIYVKGRILNIIVR